MGRIAAINGTVPNVRFWAIAKSAERLGWGGRLTSAHNAGIAPKQERCNHLQMALITASPRWYSRKHIQHICQELGLPLSMQFAVRRPLDSAAMFYRASEDSGLMIPPDKVLDQLQSLQLAIRTIRIVFTGSNDRGDKGKLKRARAKLLVTLGGKGASLADLLDGGIKPFLRNALCAGPDVYGQEAELTKLVCTLLGSSDPSAILAAADELYQRASEGIDAIKNVRGLTVLPGHSGDRRLNSWLASMLVAYTGLTGRAVATSVDAVNGTPTGPLIRFLKLAGLALGIRRSDQAWRESIRRSPAYQEQRQAQKKL
jgi:hypothetical protein